VNLFNLDETLLDQLQLQKARNFTSFDTLEGFNQLALVEKRIRACHDKCS
jgi:hypothetical protein